MMVPRGWYSDSPEALPYVHRDHWKVDVASVAVFWIVMGAAFAATVAFFGWSLVQAVVLAVFYLWGWAAYQVADVAQAWVWRWGRR